RTNFATTTKFLSTAKLLHVPEFPASASEQRRQPDPRRSVLVQRHLAVDLEELQDFERALAQLRGRALWVAVARGRQHGSEDRSLLRQQQRGRLVEPHASRCVRAVHTGTPLHHVQIQLEDARLAEPLQPPREKVLARFAPERSLL